MSRILRFIVSIAVLATIALAANATEVLYVSQPVGSAFSLLTYDVDPSSATATQMGNALTVGAGSVDPLTLGDVHLIYVWNGTDVWAYQTNAKGVPQNQAFQHLTFNYTFPVTNFLLDPNGKFAYAAISGADSHGNNYASIYLFTIDQTTGVLTNTQRKVASYGPDPYTGLASFKFGSVGSHLFAMYRDNGPHTCIVGYDSFQVSKNSGQLGPLTMLFYAQADCSGLGAVAISETLSAASAACCGSGSGYVNVNVTATGDALSCPYMSFPFCSDESAGLAFDPLSQNLFDADADTGQTQILHVDLANSQLIPTDSIAGTPSVFFSPDARLVYAVNASDIGIYAFNPGTGILGASSSLADQGGSVYIAATRLRVN